jgi:hypothetical protein
LTIVKAVLLYPERSTYSCTTAEYIVLPGQLLDKVKEAATREEITPEELVCDAVEIRLSHAEWAKTLAFGDRDARERGLKPEDVEAQRSRAYGQIADVKCCALPLISIFSFLA